MSRAPVFVVERFVTHYCRVRNILQAHTWRTQEHADCRRWTTLAVYVKEVSVRRVFLSFADVVCTTGSCR